jgi:ribosomal-protein-serine acetyltransferase
MARHRPRTCAVPSIREVHGPAPRKFPTVVTQAAPEPVFPDQLPVRDLDLVRWNARFSHDMISAVTSSLVELRAWMPWASSVPTLDEIRVTLDQGDIRFGLNEDGPYVIRDQEAELVGSTGLHRRTGPDVVEIGYWIRSDRTGRGYATSVARALSDAAFHCDPRIEHVEIVTHERNAASQAVARKLGYQVVREVPKGPQGSAPEGNFLVWSVDRDAWPYGPATAASS